MITASMNDAEERKGMDAHMLTRACSLQSLLFSEPAFRAHAPQLQSFQRADGGPEHLLRAVGQMLGHCFLLEEWSHPWDFACAPTGALVCPDAHKMTIALTVRGIGLAASAYGMLHCPHAVSLLVAHRRAGPWAGRLQPINEYLLRYHAVRIDITGNPGVSAEDVERAAGRLARIAEHKELFSAIHESSSLACMSAALRALAPLCAGGGRAAALMPVVYMPHACTAWDAQVVEPYIKGLEHDEETQVDEWDMMLGSTQLPLAPGVHAMPRQAGSALDTALATPCTLRDTHSFTRPLGLVELTVK
jgi:hypothetical protein